MSRPSCSPLPDLIEESFDEAIFLWGRWENELASLTRGLDEVWSWTEDRLQGALDGVRVANVDMVGVATAQLATKDPNTLAVCAALLGSSSFPQGVAALVSAIADARGSRLAALLRGLEVAGTPHALSAVAQRLADGEIEHRAAVFQLKAFRRARLSEDVLAAFATDEPALQAAVLRAARSVSAQTLEELVGRGLESPDSEVRLEAVKLGMVRKLAVAQHAALRFASQLHEHSARYLNLIALIGSNEDQEVVYAALRVPQLQRSALWALGHIGTTRAAETCLLAMQHDHLARLAGESYCCITGADLERDHLASPEPAPEAPSYEEDDLDADLVPKAEMLWSLPNIEAIRKHWATAIEAYEPDIRYVRGQPANFQSVMAAVETGPMLRRPDLIFQLASKTRLVYDVEPRAFTAQQRQMMSASRAALRSNGTSP